MRAIWEFDGASLKQMDHRKKRYPILRQSQALKLLLLDFFFPLEVAGRVDTIQLQTKCERKLA
jgi:hypothetical protein